MRLLVTGGCGFIGSNFISHWLSGHPRSEIVNLDLMTYAADMRNLEGVEGRGCETVVGDIADRDLVSRIVRDVDAVVNFAAETHVDSSIMDSARFVHSNVIGVHSILEACRKHEKRLHHVSTDEVYGSLGPGEGRFTESSGYAPMNPYSATKAAGDHLVRAYFNTYGIKATISNCGNNYGPRQHAEKLVPKTITNAMLGRKIPVYGSGRQIRDWIYVWDHCSAIEAILEKGRLGETYLVGASNEMENINVIKSILRTMGKQDSLIEHVADRPGHDARYALDPSKLVKETGWICRYGFEEGMKATVDWYLKRIGS